jgi:hypothetical protein
MPDQTYDEWLTDFSAAHQTMEDLERLLARSRQMQDEDLRRLAKVLMHLRHLVKDGLLPALSATKPELTDGQRSMIELARRIVHDSNLAHDA